MVALPTPSPTAAGCLRRAWLLFHGSDLDALLAAPHPSITYRTPRRSAVTRVADILPRVAPRTAFPHGLRTAAVTVLGSHHTGWFWTPSFDALRLTPTVTPPGVYTRTLPTIPLTV